MYILDLRTWYRKTLYYKSLYKYIYYYLTCYLTSITTHYHGHCFTSQVFEVFCLTRSIKYMLNSTIAREEGK